MVVVKKIINFYDFLIQLIAILLCTTGSFLYLKSLESGSLEWVHKKLHSIVRNVCISALCFYLAVLILWYYGYGVKRYPQIRFFYSFLIIFYVSLILSYDTGGSLEYHGAANSMMFFCVIFAITLFIVFIKIMRIFKMRYQVIIALIIFLMIWRKHIHGIHEWNLGIFEDQFLIYSNDDSPGTCHIQKPNWFSIIDVFDGFASFITTSIQCKEETGIIYGTGNNNNNDNDNNNNNNNNNNINNNNLKYDFGKVKKLEVIEYQWRNIKGNIIKPTMNDNEDDDEDILEITCPIEFIPHIRVYPRTELWNDYEKKGQYDLVLNVLKYSADIPIEWFHPANKNVSIKNFDNDIFVDIYYLNTSRFDVLSDKESFLLACVLDLNERPYELISNNDDDMEQFKGMIRYYNDNNHYKNEKHVHERIMDNSNFMTNEFKKYHLIVRVKPNMTRVSDILEILKTNFYNSSSSEEIEIQNIEKNKKYNIKPEKTQLSSEINKMSNVLVLYLDAVSRRHFIRKLPKTVQFLQEFSKRSCQSSLLNISKDAALHHRCGAVSGPFFKYHSYAPFTGPNLEALFFGGTNLEYTFLLPSNGSKVVMKSQTIPIWETYSKIGYTTTALTNMCEDWPSTYMNKTFRVDTDFIAPFCESHYYNPNVPFSNFQGPYSIRDRCLHGKKAYEHIFHYLKKYWKKYDSLNIPRFVMATIMEGHEGTGEVIGNMDDDLVLFLQEFENLGYLNDTFVIFTSDHGLHMSPWVGMNLKQAVYETYLPLLLFILPERFRNHYKKQTTTLQENINSFVGPVDIYTTLLDILLSSINSHFFPNDNVENDIMVAGKNFSNIILRNKQLAFYSNSIMFHEERLIGNVLKPPRNYARIIPRYAMSLFHRDLSNQNRDCKINNYGGRCMCNSKANSAKK